jgi:hypothetical protein
VNKWLNDQAGWTAAVERFETLVAQATDRGTLDLATRRKAIAELPELAGLFAKTLTRVPEFPELGSEALAVLTREQRGTLDRLAGKKIASTHP